MMAEPEKPKGPKRNPKLSDAERLARFLDMAHEVEAATDENAAEKAFLKVTQKSGAG